MGGKTWSNDELMILKENSYGKTYDELSKLLPNRTRATIEGKCQALGLNKYIKLGNCKTWLDEDMIFLKNNHGKIPIVDIAKMLNKTKAEVSYQIRKLRINCQIIWSDEEVELLFKNYKSKDVRQLSSLLKTKTEKQIYKKMTLLKLTCKPIDKTSYMNLNEVFKDYKRILKGEINKMKKDYPLNYDILLFKYYLKVSNIIPTKDWVYSIHFSKFMKSCRLWNRIKKKWHSSYDFISACFPQYNLKEYNFKTLQVREGFWKNDFNCYDNIKYGIKQALKNNSIENPEDILIFNLDDIYKYFNRTMIYYRGKEILYKYLDFYKIPYDSKLYWNDIRFDSIEEMSVYKYIKNNHEFQITKCRNIMFYNDMYNEGYKPDFLIEDKDIIIEYFGLYLDKESLFIKNYIDKTNRKIEYYSTISKYNFIYLYPEDLKNNFEGVSKKLAPFI